MSESHAAIVIPALNEANSIGKILESVKSLGTVIVVNDGSSDNTEEISKSAGAIVVNHSSNKGYDAALLSGIDKAHRMGKKIVVTMDADGQHDPAYVMNAISIIESGDVKIVLTYRDRKARFSEHIYGFIAKRIYGIEDILCGLKAFHIDIYSAYGYIMKKQTIGTGLAICSVKGGNNFVQFPISVKDRENGSSKMGKEMQVNYSILKGMFRALF